MAYFERHVFVCTNARNDDSRKSCGDHNVGKHAACVVKNECLKAHIHGEGKIRVSQSGCLGRCEDGPLLVIYPEARWYNYHSDEDLKQIVAEDLVAGRAVEHLLLDK